MLGRRTRIVMASESHPEHLLVAICPRIRVLKLVHAVQGSSVSVARGRITANLKLNGDQSDSRPKWPSRHIG